MVEEDKTQNTQPPSEAEIEELLARIRPRPSNRFYRIMKKAPWERKRFLFGPGLLRPLAATVLLMVILLGAAITLPSVQAAARQLLRFFVPSTSDQRTVVVPLPLPGSQAGTYYALSLEQAQTELGYTLKTPAALPDELVFSGAHVDPDLKSASLRYTNGKIDLIFTQHPLGNVEEYSSIGASAVVEHVQVRGVDGEYVSGAWRIKPTQATIQETSLPGTQTNLGLYWDPDLPQHILRWQESGMAYEILCTGDTIGKEGLITIANSIR